jgi:excisionase family DNA binding protein
MSAQAQESEFDRFGVFHDRLPSPDEVANANMLRTILAAEVREDEPTELRVVRPGGETETLTLMPALAYSLLELLRHVGQGRLVTVVPVDAKLTTQKAADLLNVSRPHLIKLIDRGELPCEMVGRHRRVQAQDVLDYKAKRDRERAEALAAMAAADADLL